MKTIEVEFNLNIGYANAEHQEVVSFEFADNANETDIDNVLSEYWAEWINGYIDGGWKIVRGR